MEEAFAEVSEKSIAAKEKISTVTRLDKGGYDHEWNKGDNAHRWAKTAAVNEKGTIHYQFIPSFGESSLDQLNSNVALAFDKGVGRISEKYAVEILVEGSEKETVNLGRELIKKSCSIHIMKAKDVNRDGRIDIRVSPQKGGIDNKVFLNCFWAYPENLKLNESHLVSGNFKTDKVISMPDAELQTGEGLSRNDVILVEVKNNSGQEETVAPELIVKSTRSVTFDTRQGSAYIDENVVKATLTMQSVRQILPEKWLVALTPIKIGAGQSKKFAIKFCGGSEIRESNITIEDALSSREAIKDYWIAKSGIPYGKILVPDFTIQSLLESSVRNIWQARELKNGVPVFQVGPTVYRGLWVVDGAFLLEAASMLGATAEARKSIEYTVSQQSENGAFQLLSPKYFKENGIVIWTIIRHALLCQDKKWLEGKWSSIEKAMNYISLLRKNALVDKHALWYGINQPGEIDGGLSGHGTGFKYGEYSNAYWNLAGMKAAIFAARWLQKNDMAEEWKTQYDAFYDQFRKSASRDMRKDAVGNHYLPIFMGNATNALPQSGQWSFCQAVYPGQLFEKSDTLVAGNLAMLENTEQEGMVVGTGWIKDGIWNYFASFYGHACLWQGNGEKASGCLYAMAGHASPTLNWREEHNTNDNGHTFVGDMPHNWASAEFIRLTSHLLALDRGDELHLLEGFPGKWSGAGMTTALKGIMSPFGPITMEVSVNPDGKQARIKLKKIVSPNLRKVVIHLKGLTGEEKTTEVNFKEDYESSFMLSQ